MKTRVTRPDLVLALTLGLLASVAADHVPPGQLHDLIVLGGGFMFGFVFSQVIS
jgi:hypothetical protein